MREQQLAHQRGVASRPPSELGERGVGRREDGDACREELRKLLAQPAEAERVAQRLEARLARATPKVRRGAHARLGRLVGHERGGGGAYVIHDHAVERRERVGERVEVLRSELGEEVGADVAFQHCGRNSGLGVSERCRSEQRARST